MEEEEEARPLEEMVEDESMLEAPVFWMREFKDPDAEVSAQKMWNSATSQERARAAQWIRGWEEEENIEHLKEVMGCLDGMLQEVFGETEAAEAMRRWVAAVLLDVFSEKEDLATSVEMQQRPKFDTDDMALRQFDRLTAFEDLWSGEGSRAEELTDLVVTEATLPDGEIVYDIHIVLTRWIVATAIAELLHFRAKTQPEEDEMQKEEDEEAPERQKNVSAREALIAKANAIRGATNEESDDESEQYDDEWQEDDVVDTPDLSTRHTEEDTVVESPGGMKTDSLVADTKKSSSRPPPPQRMGPRKQTAVGEHYEENQVEARRHERGYDVLDTEMQAVAQDDKTKARLLLVEHVEAMTKAGLVFELEINDRRLGFSVSLARFGDKGRRFVVVDASERLEVKPGDELVSINQAYVVNPTDESIPQIIRFVDDAPRPVLLKFIKGEGTEDEERTSTEKPKTKKHSKEVSKVVLAVKDSLGLPRLQCTEDGRVTKFRSFKKNTKHKGRLVGFFTVDNYDYHCADQKGILLGSLKVSPSDPSQAEIFDDQERILAYCDLGSLKLTDTRRTTKFQVEISGTVRAHDGLHCATVTDFHPNSHFKLLALVSTLLVTDLFDHPGKRPASVARIVRKASSKVTGMSGFFA